LGCVVGGRRGKRAANACGGWGVEGVCVGEKASGGAREVWCLVVVRGESTRGAGWGGPGSRAGVATGPRRARGGGWEERAEKAGVGGTGSMWGWGGVVGCGGWGDVTTDNTVVGCLLARAAGGGGGVL